MKHFHTMILVVAASVGALLANAAEASNLRLRGRLPAVYQPAGSGNSPIVLPGATPATACVLANNCTFSTPTTTYAGSSGDFAYNLPVVARWAAPQLIEVGYAGAAVSRQIGILAFHQPNAAQFAAGFDDDVCSIDITVDGGSTYTITGPTYNADDKETDWNFTVVNGAAWADGIHRVDAIVKPCSGPSLTLRGPLEFSPSNHTDYVSTGSRNGGGVIIHDGTYLAAGQIMTVADGLYPNDNWRDGWDVSTIGIEHNTRVDGTSTVNPTSCAAATGSNCTGAGGPGTYHVSMSQLGVGAQFTASQSGNILTVSAVASGYIDYGMGLFGSGVSAESVDASQIHDGGGNCGGGAVNLCTGTGGIGTYDVSVSQTFGSRTMTANVPAVGAIHHSFYFLTNYGGALTKYVEYASNSGTNGGTHGDSAADPTADIGQAVSRAWTRASGGNSGLYGAKICVMGGGTFWANQATPSGNRLNNNYGWLDIVKAEGDPQCNVAGTGTLPTINTDYASNNTSTGSNRERWAHVIVNGALEANVGTWADYVTATGLGLTYSLSGHETALLAYQATACTNSTISVYFSGCRGDIVRNNTMDLISEDFVHGANVIVGNTFRDGGNVYQRLLGSVTSGGTVITVTSNPTGYTLAQLFTTVAARQTSDIDIGGCLGGNGSRAIVQSVNDTTHTITLVNEDTGNPIVASCSTTGNIIAVGVHGDMVQFQDGLAAANAIILNNDANDVTIGYQQGLFSEIRVDGLVFKGNSFQNQQTTEFYIQVTAGQYNWTLARDAWNEQGSTTSGFNLFGPTHSFWLDMNNTCTGTPVGGTLLTYTPGGTNIRTQGGSCR